MLFNYKFYESKIQIMYFQWNFSIQIEMHHKCKLHMEF